MYWINFIYLRLKCLLPLQISIKMLSIYNEPDSISFSMHSMNCIYGMHSLQHWEHSEIFQGVKEIQIFYYPFLQVCLVLNQAGVSLCLWFVFSSPVSPWVSSHSPNTCSLRELDSKLPIGVNEFLCLCPVIDWWLCLGNMLTHSQSMLEYILCPPQLCRIARYRKWMAGRADGDTVYATYCFTLNTCHSLYYSAPLFWALILQSTWATCLSILSGK